MNDNLTVAAFIVVVIALVVASVIGGIDKYLEIKAKYNLAYGGLCEKCAKEVNK